MITGTLKSQIDQLWLEFWTGGITNPLTVIEQISMLMFLRLLDTMETRNERKAKRLNRPHQSFFTPEEQKLRWKEFQHLPPEAMLHVIRDEVFPHFKQVAGQENTFGKYLSDAQMMIQKPALLVKAVNMINAFPLTEGDVKGDLYEYLLSKLTTAGVNGQFRTPRHIIRMMVEMLAPQPDIMVADPSCGTAGFLVEVMGYLMRENTSEEGIIENDEGESVYTGDLLEPHREHIQQKMFHGFDFDVTMLRIAAMNLLLHGIDQPHIHYQDTLSGTFTENFPQFEENVFDMILANPPFKGSLDEESVHPDLRAKVKTKKTELLFLALILKMLKVGGRSATIVPDGVLFGSSKAHVSLRKLLVEENQLEGIISLPSGVFKPYAGVSTAVLLFTKGGKTDHVFFYDLQNDGLSLDDKRQAIQENDIPDAIQRWKTKDPAKDTDRTNKAFFVPLVEIQENQYDLSLNRYKEVKYEEVQYDPPQEIIQRVKKLQESISKNLEELEEMLL